MSTDALTPTELRVLAHVHAGHSLAETAIRLGCGVRTVKVHRRSIRRKFGGTDQGQAWLVRLARRYRDRLPGVA